MTTTEIKYTKHLCDSCIFEFATCNADRLVFGIDRNPSVRGTDVDKIIECDTCVQEKATP